MNPSRQFAQARNAQRESNVATILNAIGQNIADNKGTFTCTGSGTINGTAKNIGDTAAIDLGCLTPTYIPTGIPFDPNGGDVNDTLYTVEKDSVGRYTVCSPEWDQEDALPGIADNDPDRGGYCLTR